jgi:hypothetical protein
MPAIAGVPPPSPTDFDASAARDAALAADLRQDMAPVLNRVLDEHDFEDLVLYLVREKLSPADFETLHESIVNQIPNSELRLKLKSALVRYARAKFRPDRAESPPDKLEDANRIGSANSRNVEVVD